MNLNAIVGNIVSAINPPVTATLQKSTGYTTNSSGKRVPTYAAPVTISVQRQALQSNELKQLDGLNIQGDVCAMYISGEWQGVNRVDGAGGDVVTLPDGSIWLVAIVLEDWLANSPPAWVKCAMTRQIS